MAVYAERYQPPVQVRAGEQPHEAVFRARVESSQKLPRRRVKARLMEPRDLDYDLRPSWGGRRTHGYYLRVGENGKGTLWIRPKRVPGENQSLDENMQPISKEERQVMFSEYRQARYPIMEKLPNGTVQFETVLFWTPEFVRKSMT